MKISHVVSILIFSIFIFSVVAFFSYRVSYAYFTDTVVSAGYTFTTASNFNNVGEEGNGSVANHIVISEVQISTSNSTTDDFIELYNPTSSVINLGPYRLVKRTSSGTSDTSIVSFSSTDVIPANGYFLWASNDNDYASNIGADADTSQNISANNSIALREGPLNTGNIIDAVGWGNPTGEPLFEGTLFASNPGDGESIERKAVSTSTASTMITGEDEIKGNGYDTYDNLNNFVLREVSHPQNSSISESL